MQVTGTHNDEEGLHRRLTIYRDTNQEDESVINYFDELEFFPEKLGMCENAYCIGSCLLTIGFPQ